MEKQKFISFSELFFYIKQSFVIGLNNWKKIFLFGFIGGIIGFSIAYFNKPIYKASLSFILTENEGSSGFSLASLAGLSGITGMGGGGNVNEDKLQFISQSRKIIGSTLLHKSFINGENDFLANHFIKENKMLRGFSSDTSLKNFSAFTHDNLNHLNYAENKVLDKIVSKIVKGGMYWIDAKKKSGIVSQNAGILSINFISKNEEFSKEFVTVLYKKLSDFYTQKSIQKQMKSYLLIKQRADSLQGLLFEKEAYGANYFDRNIGMVKMQGRLELERTKRDVEMLGLMYAEVLKNQEIARFALENQTPAFQVIDEPTLPLEKEKMSKMYTAIGVALLFGIIGFIWFFVKSYKSFF